MKLTEYLAPVLALVLGAVLAMGMTATAHADEGMWTFDNLPLKQLKERYGFTPPPGWAEHLRSSAVRFNNGGSGSFVSADGLIMTNHHVGADTLSKLSTARKDYHRDGFFARTFDEEVKAPDLELNVLTGIEDVTERVNRAVNDEMGDVQAAEARRRAMAEIEKEATDKNHLRNDVVTLYQGGQYHLYTYKKYTDVRLVFAPEFDIAFFGGDPDNFGFPRYDLDVCFFRAYEDGKPARVKHHLEWGMNGTKDGELVFVAGHPGRTDRLNTVASLQYLRDRAFPALLAYLEDQEAFLKAYGSKGAEAARHSKEDLFHIQNSLKARRGGLAGLRDAEFMKRKERAEAELKAAVRADKRPGDTRLAAWDKIAEAQKVAADTLTAYSQLERGWAFDSVLFDIARTLVRMADERAKPNSERLKEHRDSALDSLKLKLFSTSPIYSEFEEAKLAHSLAAWKKAMPDEAALIERALGGRSPEEAAKALVQGTKLADVAVRRRLAEQDAATIKASQDPMIQFALAVDAAARTVRKTREDLVEGVEAANYAIIAKALFEAHGASIYPDATFTLRLAFGAVKGYEEDGKTVVPYTVIGGAFEHARAHGDRPPYQLPESWFKARDAGALHLDVPLNFVSTADIIGGNSGSPVVNRANQVVGLIFDGNIQSLVLDFGYDDRQARAVSVDARGILEALKSVYHADRLVRELGGKTNE